jgi:hypothetical protein
VVIARANQHSRASMMDREVLAYRGHRWSQSPGGAKRQPAGG